tara:strand:- start:3384 stop:3920 length:537 start_codon:yes stop_codon:yes gene_type:complete
VKCLLPSAEPVALVVVVVLGVIVAWDAWWLTRQHLDIPSFGVLSNNGFAWKSEQQHEVLRQWANLGSMAVMMALPWGFASFSDTPILYVILWDVLLGLHIISLLVPKRYAVTATHLFADGQRYEWKRLVLAKRQPKKRIMLLRKGWGPFGPLPLGGAREDLDQAAERIIEILLPEEEE